MEKRGLHFGNQLRFTTVTCIKSSGFTQSTESLSTQDPPFYSYKTSESGSGLNPPKSVYLRTDQAVYGGEEAACF